MSRRYVAKQVSKETLIELAPSMSVEPLGQQAFFAFGSGTIDLAELLTRPDFDEVNLFAVVAEDDATYFAFAPHDKAVGYPPEFVRLRVASWSDEKAGAAFIEEIRTAQGFAWEGVLLPSLTPAGDDGRERR